MPVVAAPYSDGLWPMRVLADALIVQQSCVSGAA